MEGRPDLDSWREGLVVCFCSIVAKDCWILGSGTCLGEGATLLPCGVMVALG